MAECKECGSLFELGWHSEALVKIAIRSQEESQANLKRKQDAAEQKLVTEAIQAITLTTETLPI